MYLALDDQNVYWADYDTTGGWKHWHYSVQATRKTGGAPITIAEGDGAMLTPLVARDGFVHWSMATCPFSCDTSDFKTYLYRVAHHGGRVQKLEVQTSLDQLSVDEQRIYYRARWSFATDRGGLRSIRLDGSDVRELTLYPRGTGPVLEGGTLYYFDRGNNPNSTFWTALRSLPASGGTPVELRTEINTLVVPNRMVLHHGSAFVSAQVLDILAGPDMMKAGANQAGIWRVPLDGREWQKPWTAPPFWLWDANGDRIYWVQTNADGPTACVGSGNRDGTDNRCIDAGEHQYGPVRVDDTNVFFIRDGDIFSLPREG
jgi:hypothetical protein